jgi:DNA-binding transcriptional LysR family regulator
LWKKQAKSENTFSTNLTMHEHSDLEIFESVVRAQSMTVAGRELGLSTAVVSKRLKRLESRLGAQLLHRTTRHVSPTETGREFYLRISPLVDSIREAEAAASAGVKLPRGTLRISAPTSFGRMHVAPHLCEFLGMYPGLNVDLELSDEFVDILTNKYDLAVRIGELKDSGLKAKRLAPVRRVLCAAPSYLNRAGRPQTIDDLVHHTCLAAKHQSPFRLHGPEGSVTIPAKGPLQTNSSEVVREAVIAGLGIALRSTWDVGPELASGALEIILPEYQASSKVGVYAVYPQAEFTPAKVKLFIDFFHKLYRKPYWEITG